MSDPDIPVLPLCQQTADRLGLKPGVLQKAVMNITAGIDSMAELVTELHDACCLPTLKIDDIAPLGVTIAALQTGVEKAAEMLDIFVEDEDTSTELITEAILYIRSIKENIDRETDPFSVFGTSTGRISTDKPPTSATPESPNDLVTAFEKLFGEGSVIRFDTNRPS